MQTDYTTKMLTGTHAGEDMRVPVCEIVGESDGPTLTIVGGVHGVEYNGIHAAVTIAQTLRAKDLRGVLRIVTVANVPGFLARKEALVPQDEINLNRVFPGSREKSYSYALADLIFEGAVKGSDYLIDMHGGDIFEALVPYIGINKVSSDRVNEETLAMGRAYGLPYILEFGSMPGGQTDGMGLSNAAREAGIPAILAEVGGEGVLCDSDARRHIDGTLNAMRHLGMLAGSPFIPGTAHEMKTDFWRIDVEGLVYPTLELGQSVKQGDKMGVIRDWYGALVEELFAPQDAVIIAVVTTMAARPGAVIYQVAIQ